jgi:hypothetical protein
MGQGLGTVVGNFVGELGKETVIALLAGREPSTIANQGSLARFELRSSPLEHTDILEQYYRLALSDHTQ